jgi:hypothetical protein
MDAAYRSFVAQFEQLEADTQAAVAEVRASPANRVMNSMIGMTLMCRYTLLSGALARSPLCDNIRLQGLEARVLAAVTGLNAIVFRRAASG